MIHSSLGFQFHSSLFGSKLSESVKITACVFQLSTLEAIQPRAWVTASSSILMLAVETA